MLGLRPPCETYTDVWVKFFLDWRREESLIIALRSSMRALVPVAVVSEGSTDSLLFHGGGASSFPWSLIKWCA